MRGPIMRKSLSKFEYASNWSITCRRVRRLQPLCTNNPWHGRATVVHHIKYKRSFLRRFLGIFLLHFPVASVSGYEIPGWDCVGVCSRCHENYYGRSSSRISVHYHQVWVQAELQTITILRGVQALCPEITPMAQELVGAIQEIEATPNRHLSPTAIGELYASSLGLPKPIKPQIVNRVLKSAGLQTKEIQVKTDTNGKQSYKNIWHLTEKGKLWGTVTRDKARTHDKIVEHVRWLPDVLEVIDLSVEEN